MFADSSLSSQQVKDEYRTPGIWPIALALLFSVCSVSLAEIFDGTNQHGLAIASCFLALAAPAICLFIAAFRISKVRGRLAASPIVERFLLRIVFGTALLLSAFAIVVVCLIAHEMYLLRQKEIDIDLIQYLFMTALILPGAMLSP